MDKAFEFVQAPQPTVLKGRPLVPTPTMVFRPFRGFPLQSPREALVAFSVVCFLSDASQIISGELIMEVRWPFVGV